MEYCCCWLRNTYGKLWKFGINQQYTWFKTEDYKDVFNGKTPPVSEDEKLISERRILGFVAL